MTDEKKTIGRSLKRGGIGCGGAFVAFMVLGAIITHGGNQKGAVPTQQDAPNPNQVFQDAVMKKFNPGFEKRTRAKACNMSADFKTIEDKDIAITLTYNNVQPLVDVIVDTEDMTRAVLAKLMADGRKPAEDGISITVFGETPAKGETGTAKVLMYGMAHYDHYTDSVKFSQPH